MPALKVANLLTSLRGLLIFPMVASILSHSWALALAVFGLAVSTDLLDGRVARWRHEASPLGGVFDHAVDALFVSTGLGALAFAGTIPWLLPPLIVVAFVQYLLDSSALAGHSLRTSFLGRNNGIGYYVLLGVPVLRDALDLSWPTSSGVLIFSWLLLISTMASISDRLMTFLLSRKARD